MDRERLTKRDANGVTWSAGAGSIEMMYKLADYEDAEEQEKLLNLSFSLHQKVWYINYNMIYNGYIQQIEITDSGILYMCNSIWFSPDELFASYAELQSEIANKIY